MSSVLVGRARRGAVPLSVLMMLIVFVPASTYYFGISTSMTLGTTVAGVIIILTVAAYPVAITGPLTRAAVLAMGIISILCVHLLIAGLIHPIDVPHAIASFIPLFVLGLGGVALGVAIQSTFPSHVNDSTRNVFITLCIIAILPSIGLDVSTIYLGNGTVKPIFPFAEPSHFAQVFMPFYFYMCVRAKPSQRLALLGLGLALVFILESLTLGLGWLVIALICTRGLIFPSIIGAGLALLLTQLDLSYFIDRLDFSDTNQNLSTLVYLQGWELATEAMVETHGWGDGFQQLGLQGTNTQSSQVIYMLVGADMNILDGGFTLAKLVGEFGVSGIVAGITLLTAIVRSIAKLRNSVVNSKQLSPNLLFPHTIFVSYLMDFLVRGSGYFTGTMLLLVTSLYVLHNPEEAEWNDAVSGVPVMI